MIEHEAKAIAAEQDWQSILDSPEYFLDAIDLQRASFKFVKTSREIISSSSFLDGRTALSESDRSYFLPIKEALSWHKLGADNRSVNRFIFHMSFCGSTLVARVLDQPGIAIAHKEPQILLQLAEIKAANADWYRNNEQWQALMNFVLSQLSKRWLPDEVVVIKPSNWANSMLPQFIECGGQSRALFLNISPSDFLISVFRGGSDRVQFTYAVLKHLVTSFPEFTKVIADVEAEADKLSSADMFARLALIVHAIQQKAFARAVGNLSLIAEYRCHYQDLLNSPIECLQQAAIALDLDFKKSQLTDSISKNFSNHSKVTRRSFDVLDARKVDQQVCTAYNDTFSRAFEWAEKALTKTTFPKYVH
jgi:hypothetical protein